MPLLNLYLLSQSQHGGYDTWDSCVVAAKSTRDARKIHPSGRNVSAPWEVTYSGWAESPDKVTAELIGKAKRGTKPGVICSSFNAG